ncbi:MAG TPA: sugar transferase [Myxococcales bacterium]|nr:sugar transferase [Myxococcales bacterium]
MLMAVAVTAARSGPFTLDMLRETPWVLGTSVFAWLMATTALRHYSAWAHDRALLDDVAMTTVSVGAAATGVALMKMLVANGQSFPDVIKLAVFLWPSVVVLRVVVFRNMASRGAPLDEVLVIGSGPLGRATADFLRGKRSIHVIGQMRFPDEKVPPHSHGQFLGCSDELDSILKTVSVSEVYVAGNVTRQGEAMQSVVQVCERYGVPFALPAHTLRFDRARPIEQGNADGYVHYLSYDAKLTQRALKRLFDIASSAAALWMLLPLFAVVAAVIKLTSKGPIFFKQQRVGLNGRPFHMLKFRSMVVNAEELKAKLAAQNEQTGPVFKMKNDPRITGIGKFIRKFSIDELPQLINILRGDMSVVGPRPPVPSEVAKYEAWQRRRLSVRPGLTCIWQVSGRNSISFDQWMYLDMQYIDHWSFGSDLQLIFRTFPVVLTGRGAS